MQFLTGFHKSASLGMNAYLGDTGGSKSDTADTTVTQLKWDSRSDAIPENFGYTGDKQDNRLAKNVVRAMRKLKRR